MADPGTVVFVHAHPDDEAIFTGGTMARLAQVGVPVALVVATSGEQGEVPVDHPLRRPDGSGPPPAELGAVRRNEAVQAARLLGVEVVEFLGYTDSGMAGEAANDDPACFWSAPVPEAADRLAELLTALAATSVVGYDPFGVYGHPDHIQVTRVVHHAAAAVGIETVYGTTVDREHLHFVESHVVEEAVLAGDLGLVRSRIGVASVEVAATVDVRSTLGAKRAAMAAHASQIPESANALQLPSRHFADVYGWEWYIRSGPEGPIDRL